MEVTINIPRRVFNDVSQLAKRRRKSIDTIIQQAVLREMQEHNDEKAEKERSIERPLADYQDEEVLLIAKSMMPEKESNRMSDLLYENQNGKLTARERNELDSLMLVYQLGNLRKAQGIYEAVVRALVKSPEDLR